MSSIQLIKSYKGKRVLVCGASGMTGMNLFAFMDTLGADVVGTYHSHKVAYINGMSMISDPIDLYHQVDFTNKAETQRFFQEFAPFDYVFVCCAKTYNAFVCEENPASMILPNLEMLSNILENSLRQKVGRVLYMSSATVYQPLDRPIRESELDWNKDPYTLYQGVGWMKRYAEKLCEFYTAQGLKVGIVRPSNIYGRFDKLDEKLCHVIPALVLRALRQEDPFIIHGTGAPVKDFIHVDDLVRNMAIVACEGDSCIPTNLCSGELVSIMDLTKIILRLTKHKPTQIQTTGDFDRVPYRALSREGFDFLFGKQTYTPLEDGIKDVVEWYSSLLQIQKR